MNDTSPKDPNNWAEIWTGQWRWMAEIANYTDPNRMIKSQLADIKVVGRSFYINQRFELHDGTRLGWNWDGAFDGIARPIRWNHDGSDMIDIAFHLMKDGMGGDIYSTRDGKKSGCEYWLLKPRRLDVWGSYTIDGKQGPYYEAWEQLD